MELMTNATVHEGIVILFISLFLPFLNFNLLYIYTILHLYFTNTFVFPTN